MTKRPLPVLVVALAWACGSSPMAPSPSAGPSPIPATAGVAALSGTVFEWRPDGQRPLPNVDVNAWVQTATFGYSYWFRNGRLKSDAQGRFELKDLPVGATVYLDVSSSGYQQQCAAETLIAGPSELDGYLIPQSSLSASPANLPSRPGTRYVAGVVYEATPAGRGVLPDAGVVFEAIPEFNVAGTISDGQGRFLLCGLPPSHAVRIAAYSGDRYGAVTVPVGGDATIELEVR